MTTAIAQFMRELERAWDGHRDALLARRDVAAALAPLAAEPSVVHIPAMTGAAGRAALERFYAEELLPHLPGDLALKVVSRTVDRWRLVDETTVSFTHDRVLPWLLPGVEPTFRPAKVLAIAVVGFERTRIRSQRVLWDHATLAGQLGLVGSVATGPVGTGPVGTASVATGPVATGPVATGPVATGPVATGPAASGRAR